MQKNLGNVHGCEAESPCTRFIWKIKNISIFNGRELEKMHLCELHCLSQFRLQKEMQGRARNSLNFQFRMTL